MTTIGVIGAGNMGEALISGLLGSGKIEASSLIVAEVREARAKYISGTYGVKVEAEAVKVAEKSDVLFLVVKPKDAPAVLRSVRDAFLNAGEKRVLVSSVAGMPIKNVEAELPDGSQVVRIMPNLACSVGEGAIAVCRGSSVTEEAFNTVRRLLSLVGAVVELPEELFDAVTGLSGSGPAYVLTFIEALSDGGVKLGIQRSAALTLAAQTVLGAAKMLVKRGEHPAKLRDMVATPGGTTIEGLVEMEKGKFRATVINAVVKAAEKAKTIREAIFK